MANTRKRSLWDTKIVRRALVDALVKLSPRTMMKNPVMFVVEIGSVITTIYLMRDILTHQGALRFDLALHWLYQIFIDLLSFQILEKFIPASIHLPQ